MKRYLPLLALLLLLTGCGSRQLEEEMLVIVLGADETPGGDLILTIKAPSTSEEKSPSGAEEQMGYLQLRAAGHGFSEAAALLNASTPRKLNFSQVREVVIGERAARGSGLGRLLQQIDALPRMRGAATVIVCRGEAEAFIAAQKPYMGLRLSRYAETTLAHYAGKGYTPLTTLEEGIRDLGYGFQDPLFAFGAVNDFSKQSPSPGESALASSAGEMSRKSVDPIDLFGAAMTNGVSVCGALSGQEMGLLYLLQGSPHSLEMRWEKDVPLLIYARLPAEKRVDLSASPAVLSLSLLCEVHHPPGLQPDEEALKSRLTADLAAVIRKLQAGRCDGAGFGNVAVRQFATIGEWEKLHWRSVYAGADLDLHLSLRFRAY